MGPEGHGEVGPWEGDVEGCEWPRAAAGGGWPVGARQVAAGEPAGVENDGGGGSWRRLMIGAQKLRRRGYVEAKNGMGRCI